MYFRLFCIYYKNPIILILFLTLSHAVHGQDFLNGGLYFRSHEAIQDERTSLNITPEEPIVLNNGFELEFEALFREGDGHYGYITKILANGNIPIDLVSNLASETDNFWLVVGDKAILNFRWEDLGGMKFNEWITLKITYNPSKSLFALTIDEVSKSQIVVLDSKLKVFEIVFGASENPRFLNTDVCPMTLKNLKLSEGNGRLLNHWKLDKHLNDKVLDELQSKMAQVKHPVWEVNRHFSWNKIRDLVVPDLLGITYDTIQDRIFMIAKKNLTILYPRSQSLQRIDYTRGNPYYCMDNSFLYNYEKNTIVSYSFTSNVLNNFDFKTRSWSSSDTLCEETDFWHHGKFLLSNNDVVSFGGYGHYTYKSILNRLSSDTKTWVSSDLSADIPPRYLSSMALRGEEELVIFGGYGSISGRQGINSRYFYDLYRISLTDQKVTKIYELPSPSQPFTPVTSMVLDPQNEQFYTLVYNSSNFNSKLVLAKVGLEKPTIEYFEDSIAYNFLDIKSQSFLFLNNDKTQLFAVTAYDSALSIYQHAYPPVLKKQVLQEAKSPRDLSFLWGLLIFIPAVLLVRLLVKKKQKITSKLPSNEGIDNPAPPTGHHEKRKSSIFLIGGFQVYDSMGEDITSLFTPTLKHLFLLIYLYSLKNHKGISPDKLTEYIWGDKSTTSARNNRNVNISKLRIIVEKIGPELLLTNDNTYWKLTHSSAVYSDLHETMSITEKLKNNIPLSDIETERLIQNTSNGQICPGVQTEWIDAFKIEFADEVVDALGVLSLRINSPSINMRISDSVLKLDPLNEEALRVKCKALLNMGKKGLALNAYETFCRDHLQLLGEPFPRSFGEMM